MQIIAYVIAIILACAGIILYFAFLHEKQEKNIKEFYAKSHIEPVSKENLPVKEEKVEEKSVENQSDAIFEEFVLPETEEQKKAKDAKKASHNRPFVNPFDFGNINVGDKIDSDDEDDDEDELKWTDFDENDEDMSDEQEEEDIKDSFSYINELVNFDFSSLDGKDESEVKEIIKDLSPKAQEAIMERYHNEENEGKED